MKLITRKFIADNHLDTRALWGLSNPKFGIKGYCKPHIANVTGVPMPFFTKHGLENMLEANKKILLDREIEAENDRLSKVRSDSELKKMKTRLIVLETSVEAGAHNKKELRPRLLKVLDELMGKLYLSYHHSVMGDVQKLRERFTKMADDFFKKMDGNNGGAGSSAY
ncbi:Uncharacterised protein [uncultured archaeon]|nr:Uncharacterised protein [uncultured archaeon]